MQTDSHDLLIGFDLDGVLVDSLPVMEISWNKVCEKYDYDIPFISYRNNIGIPFKDILDKLGISESMHESVRNTYFSNTKKHQDQIKVFPYTYELMRMLNNNINTFIVTSKPRDNTKILLDKLNICVDRLITSDDIEFGKPHKQAGELINSHFNAQNIYYVGDMDTDRQFAINCGYKFIYANYGYGELKSHEGVCGEISSLSNLISMIEDKMNIS